LLLIDQGQLVQRNLDRAHISADELLSQVRQQGLERIEQVQRAFVESEGQLSIIPRDEVNAPRSLERLEATIKRLEATVAQLNADRPQSGQHK
jgi:uncharacterized membrane protein YcaP (DUF421 family)